MSSPTPPHIAAFLDHSPEIDDRAFIAPTAAVIGAVRIGADSSIWYQVTVRGDNNYITIGTGSNIQDNSCIHISSREFPTVIGNYVSVGHSALVHACRLEDHSFVGMGAIVMDGAVIEPTGMLAAGAMLTPGKVIPAGELWAGRPATKMRMLTPQDIADNRRIARHYIEVGRAHKQGIDGAPYQDMHSHPLPPR
ncbi:MAG: gamma carbonic anhydrase family protein [Candidatus Puniceispirillaceae bacterium]